MEWRNGWAWGWHGLLSRFYVRNIISTGRGRRVGAFRRGNHNSPRQKVSYRLVQDDLTILDPVRTVSVEGSYAWFSLASKKFLRD